MRIKVYFSLHRRLIAVAIEHRRQHLNKITHSGISAVIAIFLSLTSIFLREMSTLNHWFCAERPTKQKYRFFWSKGGRWFVTSSTLSIRAQPNFEYSAFTVSTKPISCVNAMPYEIKVPVASGLLNYIQNAEMFVTIVRCHASSTFAHHLVYNVERWRSSITSTDLFRWHWIIAWIWFPFTCTAKWPLIRWRWRLFLKWKTCHFICNLFPDSDIVSTTIHVSIDR